jgi:hypothetical protein
MHFRARAGYVGTWHKEDLWAVNLYQKPVDLSVDLSTDEDGRAVHEDCYVKRIKAVSDASAVRAQMMQWRDSKLA